MIACVGRVLRLSLAVALVSGLGFAATNAQAFIDDSLVCADPNSVLANFDDDENWDDFGAVTNCPKICKSYTKKCKTAVKNNANCINKALDGNAELEKKAFCDTEPDKDAKKECKQDVKDALKTSKEDNKTQRDSLITACEDIEADCTTVCEGGL